MPSARGGERLPEPSRPLQCLRRCGAPNCGQERPLRCFRLPPVGAAAEAANGPLPLLSQALNGPRRGFTRSVGGAQARWKGWGRSGSVERLGALRLGAQVGLLRRCLGRSGSVERLDYRAGEQLVRRQSRRSAALAALPVLAVVAEAGVSGVAAPLLCFTNALDCQRVCLWFSSQSPTCVQDMTERHVERPGHTYELHSAACSFQRALRRPRAAPLAAAGALPVGCVTAPARAAPPPAPAPRPCTAA